MNLISRFTAHTKWHDKRSGTSDKYANFDSREAHRREDKINLLIRGRSYENVHTLRGKILRKLKLFIRWVLIMCLLNNSKFFDLNGLNNCFHEKNQDLKIFFCI